MKVLVTGMTPQQSGRLPDVGYMTLTDMVIRLMKDLGHEVEVKIPVVDMPLEEYDLIVAGICSPFSVAGRHIYGVMSILDRYWLTEKIPVLSLVDDWEMHQIDQNSRSACRAMERLTRPAVFAARPGYKWACSPDGMDALTRVINKVNETGYPPAIFPAFAWGDHRVFRTQVTAENYYCLDMTCYTTPYPFTRAWPSDRRREWVQATVKDHLGFAEAQGCKWPLNIIGGGMTKRDKYSMVQEKDVIAEYGKCWGVLSPFYRRIAASGWWRNRFVYAAMTRSILYCNPREAPQLGEVYQFPMETIESFTNGQLYELAEAQAAALRAGCWQFDQLMEAGKAMVGEVTGKL